MPRRPLRPLSLGLVTLALGCGSASTPAPDVNSRDADAGVPPDIASGDATAPDASAPDTSAPDAPRSDASPSDTRTPDASAPDASITDASAPDAPAPDASITDASITDAPAPDAPITDAPGDDASDAGVCAAPLRTGTWDDLGELPASVGRVSDVLVLGARVLAATDDGLYTRARTGASAWEPAGLQGLHVQVLLASPTEPRLLIAGLGPNADGTQPLPIRVSRDGGTTWLERGRELEDTAISPPQYDSVFDGAFALDGARVFLNTQAASIVVSSDAGETWSYARGGPGYIGYPCYIGLDAEYLYQGCELPLDSAFVTRSPVAGSVLGMEEYLADINTLSNRRPNAITVVPSVRGRVYVGLEGALVRFDGTTLTWVYESPEDTPPPDRPYVYVRGTWVDPCAAEHVVFGGLVNSDQSPLLVRESFTPGASTALASPFATTAMRVNVERVRTPADAPREAYLAVTYGNFDGPQRARVLVRRFAP